MALRKSTRGCRVIHCLGLLTLTTEFLDLRSRRLSLIGKAEVIFGRVDTLYLPGTDDERWLDPEYRITPQIFVPVQEEMRDKGAISRCTDHEVNMCRPERMAPHRREQLTGGTVIGSGIAHKHSGSELEEATAHGAETHPPNPTQLIFFLYISHITLLAPPNLHHHH